MAVKIRLARHGAKKRPFYRVVVADGRMPRDGRYIELIGRYNPVSNPKVIDLDLEKIDAWIAKGAQPTNAVAHLIDVARSDAPAPEKKQKLSKKAAAKAAADSEEEVSVTNEMTEPIEADAASEMPSAKVADLVEYIVCGLVSDDEAVSLDVTDGPEGALIEVSCAEEDAGRIIGRRGRTIKAIRTLARALGSRVGTSVEVEVLG